MDYEEIGITLQRLFEGVLGLSSAQIRRIVLLCQALFGSEHIYLSHLARRLPVKHSQQDSRIRWIKRLLRATFMTQEYVYQPVLKACLSKMKLTEWHLIIDCTALCEGQADLATISLSYHKRAIPLVWRLVPYGGAKLDAYIRLIYECVPLVPATAHVIFHADTEFSGEAMLDAMIDLGWDFIIAHRKTVTICQAGQSHPYPLKDLSLTKHQTIQLEHIQLYQTRRGGLNLFAFYQPRYGKSGKLKREASYLVTSLPLSRNIKRIGRRRWGIEPFHRDYKSSGWQLHQSGLQNRNLWRGMLVVAALCYLLSVCLGRWLCKTGQRQFIDARPKRHLSLFRLGWDFIVHRMTCNQSAPFRLILYQ